MTLKDKTVLVTGANRGIGQALAAAALARGAKRVYAGTRQPLPRPDDRLTPVSLDITSTAQIQAAASQIESLDMLINNAGIALPDDLADPAALERHLAVNLFGTHAVTQAFLPRPGGYRYDPGIRHTKGIPGIGRAGHLRRGQHRGRGNLPRSRLSAHGCPLAR